MAFIIFVAIIIAFIAHITGAAPIGWLLVFSFVSFLYTALTIVSKNEVLTNFGKILFAISVLGLIYGICILNGINLIKLF